MNPMETIINTVKATVTRPVSVTCNANVKESRDVTVRRNRHLNPNRLTYLMLYALYSMLFAFFCLPLPLEAKVTGVCSNCHTMHNSQNGQGVAYDFDGTSFTRTSVPKDNLLTYSCLGCHSATDGTTWRDSITKAPIVFNTVEPTYNAAKGLAGGNFYWVKTDDTKGHNIFPDNPDNFLTDAPGRDMPCAGACHSNLSIVAGGAFAGRQGCTGCHMLNKGGKPSGYHHADDSETIVGSGTPDTDGYYRYLDGHILDPNRGVTGIKDPNWEFNPGASHNEYKGKDGSNHIDNYFGLVIGESSMTGYCVGCHAKIHWELNSSAAWLRHPSDAVLPATGEYSAYTTYNPIVPLARPNLGSIGDPTIVRPGTDMVMCLSCHRAHGSPYFKMMRWDYKSSTLSTALSGCNVCHTSKN